MKSILDLTASEAREFFMEAENYCDLELPNYFDFSSVLKKSRSIIDPLQSKSNNYKSDAITAIMKSLQNNNTKKKCKPSDYSVNHDLYLNKDNGLSWRKITILNPLLYTDLVYYITDEKNWRAIVKSISGNSNDERLIVTSLPEAEFKQSKTRKRQQIEKWLSLVELQSMSLCLDYDYIAITDITNCYGSIYTHSIEWAMSTRKQVKQNRRLGSSGGSPNNIGSVIDMKVRNMTEGQTNGIPQGSVLMDFIAELVLSYVDKELINEINSYGESQGDSKKLKESLKDIKIIRYRDDYRFFANDEQVCVLLLKLLSNVLSNMGLALNKDKTRTIRSSSLSVIKPDKLKHMTSDLYERIRSRRVVPNNLKRVFLSVLDFANLHRNSSQLKRMFLSLSEMINKLNDRYKEKKTTAACAYRESIRMYISLVVEMMSYSSASYPQGMALVSSLLDALSDDEKEKIVNSICRKIKTWVRVDYLEIWLQRVLYPLKLNPYNFTEKLCLAASGDQDAGAIWNFDWLDAEYNGIKSKKIVNSDILKNSPSRIGSAEVSVFSCDYDEAN